MARSKVPSEERVFSLVLALVASTSGLTKHELLSSVYGYSDRYREDAQRASLERQFERDKEQLRELGIPVEAVDSPGEPGNNQLTRYRISKAALQVPPGLSFTDRELMMLRMAVLAWREGSLTDEARRAAMKLESLGGGRDAPSIGVNAGFGTAEPSAPALLAAVEAGQLVEFDYQLPDRDAPLARRVYPLQLHRFEGRWHLIAFDAHRVATRVFLLARISGTVTVCEPTATDPARPDEPAALIRLAVAEMQALQRETRATVRVRTHSRADARFSRGAVVCSEDAGSRVLEFGTVDMHELAAIVASYGSDAVALEPPELRARVIELLRAVDSKHGGTPPCWGADQSPAESDGRDR
ncbi:helix-turn-helix transcriptional regulator [Leucobacter sp. NPDC015123]|uniref:helix-turn-helix transcriptional regulator n=1 Tax=Leucobacter sp. NPDC015123 TaxID=3364129 RepID=UPI0036F48A84